MEHSEKFLYDFIIKYFTVDEKMSAQVGIPMGIFNFPTEKKIPAGFSKIPMGKYPFRMEGK